MCGLDNEETVTMWTVAGGEPVDVGQWSLQQETRWFFPVHARLACLPYLQAVETFARSAHSRPHNQDQHARARHVLLLSRRCDGHLQFGCLLRRSRPRRYTGRPDYPFHE